MEGVVVMACSCHRHGGLHGARDMSHTALYLSTVLRGCLDVTMYTAEGSHEKDELWCDVAARADGPRLRQHGESPSGPCSGAATRNVESFLTADGLAAHPSPSTAAVGDGVSRAVPGDGAC